MTMLDSFENAQGLIDHILHALDENVREDIAFSGKTVESSRASAVLLLLGNHPNQTRFEPCIVLNKRSQKVKQPGDLCCPGGSISSWLDPLFSYLLKLPIFSLGRWPYWSYWHHYRPEDARSLSLLYATGLRESYEEMRLNPLSVTFMGPLPSQGLEMFRRVIFPLVGWISNQKRFTPNWEVEKIVHIPLRQLLNPDNYGCLRLNFQHLHNADLKQLHRDFPCFLHKNRNETETLWGATYRIVTIFLNLVFRFDPPPITSLPVSYRTLDENYLNGAV